MLQRVAGLLLAVAVLVSGCDSGGSPPPPSEDRPTLEGLTVETTTPEAPAADTSITIESEAAETYSDDTTEPVDTLWILMDGDALARGTDTRFLSVDTSLSGGTYAVTTAAVGASNTGSNTRRDTARASFTVGGGKRALKTVTATAGAPSSPTEDEPLTLEARGEEVYDDNTTEPVDTLQLLLGGEVLKEAVDARSLSADTTLGDGDYNLTARALGRSNTGTAVDSAASTTSFTVAAERALDRVAVTADAPGEVKEGSPLTLEGSAEKHYDDGTTAPVDTLRLRLNGTPIRTRTDATTATVDTSLADGSYTLTAVGVGVGPDRTLRDSSTASLTVTVPDTVEHVEAGISADASSIDEDTDLTLTATGEATKTSGTTVDPEVLELYYDGTEVGEATNAGELTRTVTPADPGTDTALAVARAAGLRDTARTTIDVLDTPEVVPGNISLEVAEDGRGAQALGDIVHDASTVTVEENGMKLATATTTQDSLILEAKPDANGSYSITLTAENPNGTDQATAERTIAPVTDVTPFQLQNNETDQGRHGMIHVYKVTESDTTLLKTFETDANGFTDRVQVGNASTYHIQGRITTSSGEADGYVRTRVVEPTTLGSDVNVEGVNGDVMRAVPYDGLDDTVASVDDLPQLLREINGFRGVRGLNKWKFTGAVPPGEGATVHINILQQNPITTDSGAHRGRFTDEQVQDLIQWYTEAEGASCMTPENSWTIVQDDTSRSRIGPQGERVYGTENVIAVTPDTMMSPVGTAGSIPKYNDEGFLDSGFVRLNPHKTVFENWPEHMANEEMSGAITSGEVIMKDELPDNISITHDSYDIDFAHPSPVIDCVKVDNILHEPQFKPTTRIQQILGTTYHTQP